MAIGLVGRKAGMTRVFTEDGESIPVTVIEVEPNRVTQVKTVESDGYNALQMTTGSRRASRVTRPMAGHFAKAGVEAGRRSWEVRVEEAELDGVETGKEYGVDVFEDGQYVDASGTTIGKGFAGAVKRHNFRTQDATHGNSLAHRAPGSIGQNQTPGRVFKGKKMAGHMGNKRRTTHNLQVVRVDAERNLLLIRGAVPGSKGADVMIKPAIKRLNSGELMTMQVAMQNAAGADGGTIDLSDKAFAATYNETLVHQAVTAYMAAARAGTKANKTRSDVSGGGAKPFRQKGTGRARAGTTRSPIWRGGGVTFAARPRNYEQKLNKKMYRAAMRSIFSELLRQERLVVMEEFAVESHKTADLAKQLASMNLDDVLIIVADADEKLLLASRNLPWVGVLEQDQINPVSLIAYDKVVVTRAALETIGERLA